SNTLTSVKALLAHRAFDLTNPNKARALIGSFAAANPVCFHAADGSGYEFLMQQVLAIDTFNPQTAARLIEPLIRWVKFDENRRNLMKKSLEKMASQPKLSKDIYEIVTKSLVE
ncbi:MAG: aminopeptidase N C-terminal domain-containing protein, partial [Pseudomonadota bacterium]|nr:aminopeptidase N C-terminal domain-containing protein [Pseudomonadota bacterium]